MMKMMAMAMAKRRIRALPLFSTEETRALSTAAEGSEYKQLFRRLSSLPSGGGGGDPKRSVEATMGDWTKEGRVVTESELMRMVRSLRSFKSHKTALEITDWMENKGIEFNISNQAVRLDLISKVKGIAAAENYFSSLPENTKNEKTYGALLNNYCQEKMEDKAMALFEKLKYLNYASNPLTYNNIMSLYMKLGQPQKALTYAEDMKAANISPDLFTFSLLINCYISLKDIVSVERVIEEMKERNIPLNWSMYCILASYYNSTGDFDKAEAALKKAEEVMNRRDRTPYQSLITLYAGAGNLAETTRIWELLKSSFPKMNNKSYFNYLNSLKRLGEIDIMKQCFEEWESSCVNYDVKVLSLMINAYLSKDMIEEAESLRLKGIKRGLGLYSLTLDLFVDYYLKRKDIGLALNSLEVIDCSEQQCEWTPNKEKVNAFFNYFEEAKDVDGAEKFFKILKKLNCLDSVVYESLIRIYVAADMKEPSLRRRIEEDGIEISSKSENMLETVCVID